MSKYFPIKNASACVYKWGWNTFRMQSGRSSSCHRVVPSFVDINNFESFHNTPESINDRKLMLSGEWPQNRGCQYCSNLEAASGVSDRTYHNDIPGLTPVEFSTQDQPLIVTPSISEIYIDNTCDLGCVYCRPEYSSVINQEVKKYGEYPIGLKPIEKNSDSATYFDLYVKWLTKNYQNLNSISILGGEPLLQKGFWQIVDLLDELSPSSLNLQITTNLNSSTPVLEKFVDKMYQLLKKRKIKKVIVSCSLDCWGEQSEFVRYGLNLKQWQKNFEFLISKKWLHIEVHHVVSSLTLKTAHELQEIISQYKQINPKIVQSYHMVDGGFENIYGISMFEPSMFLPQLTQLLNTFPITQEWDNASKQRLDGIVKLCSKAQHNVDSLRNLKKTLDLVDHRRNTNWKLLFPEINDYLTKHGIE
jgi:pyruvate-formate lyase-activating enzyme